MYILYSSTFYQYFCNRTIFEIKLISDNFRPKDAVVLATNSSTNSHFHWWSGPSSTWPHNWPLQWHHQPHRGKYIMVSLKSFMIGLMLSEAFVIPYGLNIWDTCSVSCLELSDEAFTVVLFLNFWKPYLLVCCKIALNMFWFDCWWVWKEVDKEKAHVWYPAWWKFWISIKCPWAVSWQLVNSSLE